MRRRNPLTGLDALAANAIGLGRAGNVEIDDDRVRYDRHANALDWASCLDRGAAFWRISTAKAHIKDTTGERVREELPGQLRRLANTTTDVASTALGDLLGAAAHQALRPARTRFPALVHTTLTHPVRALHVGTALRERLLEAGPPPVPNLDLSGEPWMIEVERPAPLEPRTTIQWAAGPADDPEALYKTVLVWTAGPGASVRAPAILAVAHRPGGAIEAESLRLYHLGDAVQRERRFTPDEVRSLLKHNLATLLAGAIVHHASAGAEPQILWPATPIPGWRSTLPASSTRKRDRHRFESAAAERTLFTVVHAPGPPGPPERARAPGPGPAAIGPRAAPGHHRVPAHYRWQRHGPKRSLVKLIVVTGYWRGTAPGPGDWTLEEIPDPHPGPPPAGAR